MEVDQITIERRKFFIDCLNRTTLMDAYAGLKKLPDKCVHMIVTSPPYWNLRDYNIIKTLWPEVCYSLFDQEFTIPEISCQLGLEDNPYQFIGHMILIFREARRVLRDDGTLWINIGDSYAAKGKNRTPAQAVGHNTHMSGGYATQMQSLKQKNKIVCGLKPKDMVGIPWMLAFALRSDGWYLRQDNIWYKPNPMPESSQDRCTKAHEYIFMFSKSMIYYYDRHAIATQVSDVTVKRLSQDIENQKGSDRAYAGKRHNGPMKASGKIPSNWDTSLFGDHGNFHKDGRRGYDKPGDVPGGWAQSKVHGDRSLESQRKGYDYRGPDDKGLRNHQGNYDANGKLIGDGLANKRSVWQISDPMDVWRWIEQNADGFTFDHLWRKYATDMLGYQDVWKISTQAFKDAHFATFPEELPSITIRAGTSAHGVCSTCGAPYKRMTREELVPGPKAGKNQVVDDRNHAADCNDQGSNREKDGHKQGYHYAVETIGWEPTCTCKAEVTKAVVLDMFAGAGTTQVTSDNLNRHSIGFEINPEYKVINDKRRERNNPLFHGQ